MNAKYEMRDGFAPKEPDGSAKFGPRPHPLDLEAVNGIANGVYANALAAAKALAPKYKPNIWRDASEDERKDFIKSKRKKYNAMLNRLHPCQPS